MCSEKLHEQKLAHCRLHEADCNSLAYRKGRGNYLFSASRSLNRSPFVFLQASDAPNTISKTHRVKMSIVPDWWRDEDYLTPTPLLHCPSFLILKAFFLPKSSLFRAALPCSLPLSSDPRGPRCFSLCSFPDLPDLSFAFSELPPNSALFLHDPEEWGTFAVYFQKDAENQSTGLQTRVLTTSYQLPNPLLLDDIVFKARNTSCSAVTRALLPCKHMHASHLTQNRFLWNKTYLPASP